MPHCSVTSFPLQRWIHLMQQYPKLWGKPAQWPYCHQVPHPITKENRISFKKKLCFCKYFELPFLVENKSLLSINLRTSSLPLLIPITVLSFHFCAYITARDITAIAICEQKPHPGLSKAEHTCIQLLLSQQGSAYSSRIFPKRGVLRNSSRLRWRFLSNTSKAKLVSQLWRSIAEWEPMNPPLKAKEENGVTLTAGGTNQERKWKSWKELEEYKGKYKEKEMSQTMRLIPS